jgi:hypothetical protein
MGERPEASSGIAKRSPAWLNEATPQFVIVFMASVAAAVLFYFLGGSLASVSGDSGTFLGFGFKATGAIAGFVIIFMISSRSLRNLGSRPNFTPLNILRLRVRGQPAFSRNDVYHVVCTIIGESGEKSEVQPDLGWEPPSYLTFDLRNIRPDDRIQATITNAQGLMWQINRFFIWDQLREAFYRPVKISTWAESQVGQQGGEISIRRAPISVQLEPSGVDADRAGTFTPQPSSQVVSNSISLGSGSMEAIASGQLPHPGLQQRKPVTERD